LYSPLLFDSFNRKKKVTKASTKILSGGKTVKCHGIAKKAAKEDCALKVVQILAKEWLEHIEKERRDKQRGRSS
jgi:hypothetical protein